MASEHPFFDRVVELLRQRYNVLDSSVVDGMLRVTLEGLQTPTSTLRIHTDGAVFKHASKSTLNVREGTFYLIGRILRAQRCAKELRPEDLALPFGAKLVRK